MNPSEILKKESDPKLQLLLLSALGLSGFYLFRKYKAEGMNGMLDVGNFVETASTIVPHPIAQNPIAKKIAKEIISKQLGIKSE